MRNVLGTIFQWVGVVLSFYIAVYLMMIKPVIEFRLSFLYVIKMMILAGCGGVLLTVLITTVMWLTKKIKGVR